VEKLQHIFQNKTIEKSKELAKVTRNEDGVIMEFTAPKKTLPILHEMKKLVNWFPCNATQ
jgi:hypothetical protein